MYLVMNEIFMNFFYLASDTLSLSFPPPVHEPTHFKFASYALRVIAMLARTTPHLHSITNTLVLHIQHS